MLWCERYELSALVNKNVASTGVSPCGMGLAGRLVGSCRSLAKVDGAFDRCPPSAALPPQPPIPLIRPHHPSRTKNEHSKRQHQRQRYQRGSVRVVRLCRPATIRSVAPHTPRPTQSLTDDLLSPDRRAQMRRPCMIGRSVCGASKPRTSASPRSPRAPSPLSRPTFPQPR